MGVTTTSLTVRYRVTPGMLLRGYWKVNTRLLATLSSLYLAITVHALVANRNADDFRSVLILLAAGWTLWLLAFAVSPWMRSNGWVREPNLAGDLELTIDENGLVGRNEHGESKFLWSAFLTFLETRSVFVLRYGKKQIVVVPKVAFASQEEVSLFREILTRGIGKGH